MGKPIKAFLGKSYTKNGITKTYMYNPNTESYGWYNVGAHATQMGTTLMNEAQSLLSTTIHGDTKAKVLRTNIKTVLAGLDESNIEGLDDLIDYMMDRLDSMSDYEIEQFSENNKKSINLYFEYKDVTDTGVDARIINLAKSMGIDVYDYIESEDVPEAVTRILNNINTIVKFEGDYNANTFDEIDIEPVDIGIKSGKGDNARTQKWVG